MKDASRRLRAFYKELEDYGFKDVYDNGDFLKNEFTEGKYELINSLGQKVTISVSIVCLNITIAIDNEETHNILYHASMYDVSGMFICLDTLNILANGDGMFKVFIGK